MRFTNRNEEVAEGISEAEQCISEHTGDRS